MKKALLLLPLLLAACSPTRVISTDAQAGVDFTTYKTYNFLDVTARSEATLPGPGGVTYQLKEAVAAQLQRRGYRQAAQPDMWVNIGVVVQDRVQTRQTDIRDAPRYIGQRNYHWQSQEVVVNQYEEGTATVELVDAARNERVWSGAVASTITRNSDKLEKRIEQAMESLFARYPVPPKQ
ncbi:DUF4136 domain-containing protein [Hymenobacter crusticola]|uniref:DUF4136 domain-containing protein n=1 Tax=Hymenobacter crusticola TaxID=1770526 RepID=A0A243WJP0_9BACT|nr:DUF4136 domain-containing protein [Hymenobacter crusticola]OUJ76113.1 hypothetical protein BXP70_02220 [Hymenobacter crusticola]